MRIVGGQFRGRTLATPKNAETIRPTADRVRESIFNILGQRCDGLRVLDLFAGTGAMGLEALSRGAVAVVLVDAGKESLMLCRDNVKRLQCETQCTVQSGDVVQALSVLSQRPERFDLIFADPPYALTLGPAFMQQLSPLAASRARFVYEHSAGMRGTLDASRQPRLRRDQRVDV
jgi:16S rRNA (guanine966-N2)-methyltransferase